MWFWYENLWLKTNSNKKKKKHKVFLTHFAITLDVEIIYVYIKLADRNQGQPKRSLFNSYYTKVWGEGATPFLGLLPFHLIRTL